jgi:hypothetical protein
MGGGNLNRGEVKGKGEKKRKINIESVKKCKRGNK